MYTDFIEAHDGPILSRLEKLQLRAIYIIVKEGSVTESLRLKIRWSWISSNCCTDVVPLPKEKPATVITKLIITVTISSNLIGASAALYFTNHSVQV